MKAGVVLLHIGSSDLTYASFQVGIQPLPHVLFSHILAYLGGCIWPDRPRLPEELQQSPLSARMLQPIYVMLCVKPSKISGAGLHPFSVSCTPSEEAHKAFFRNSTSGHVALATMAGELVIRLTLPTSACRVMHI